MSRLEVAVAVFAPLVASIALSRLRWFDPAFRRIVLIWFTPLVVIWYAPFWLTGSTLAPLDFLFFQIPPWSSVAPPGFISYTGLLSDAVLQFLPWREIVVDAYRHGELPLLNRYAGSGSPLWPNPTGQVLYPLTILGIPFSTFAWPVFASVSKTLIALWGMFLFLRAISLSDRAATFGAIAWAFCTYNSANTLFTHTNVSVFLPWMLLAIYRFSVAGSAIAVAMLLHGGHPESVLHVAFLAVPFAIREILLRDRPERGRLLLRLTAGAFIGALLTAPVTIPFLELLPLSERAAHYENHSAIMTAPAITPANLAAFIFPAAAWSTRSTAPRDNFNEMATGYAGLTVLALALCAAATQFRQQRFWIVLAAIFLILGFRSGIHELLLRPIPVIGIGAHGRVRFLIAFIVSVLAAQMLDSLPPRRVTAVVGTLLAVLVTLLAFAAETLDPVVVFASAIVGMLSVSALVVPRLSRLLPLLLFADLAVLGMGYHSPNPAHYFYPPTPAIRFLQSQPGPFRIVGLGSTLMPNSSVFSGLENVAVHDPMSLDRYGLELKRGGYDRGGYFGSFATVPPQESLSSWNVRFVVTRPDDRVDGMPVVYRGADATVYLNPGAEARFSVAAGTVKTSVYGRNGAVLDIQTPMETRAIAREASVPGWRLTRDGVAWPFRWRDEVSMEWKVPAGTARYELSYRPPGLTAGWLCLGAGILALAYVSFRPRNSQIVARR